METTRSSNRMPVGMPCSDGRAFAPALSTVHTGMQHVSAWQSASRATTGYAFGIRAAAAGTAVADLAIDAVPTNAKRPLGLRKDVAG